MLRAALTHSILSRRHKGLRYNRIPNATRAALYEKRVARVVFMSLCYLQRGGMSVVIHKPCWLQYSYTAVKGARQSLQTTSGTSPGLR